MNAPELGAQTENACPDLPPVTDGTLGGLSETVAADAKQYRICQAGHVAAVKAYKALRQLVIGLPGQGSAKGKR